MFLSAPSSNGTLSVYLAPGIFRDPHQLLPMGAAVDLIRPVGTPSTGLACVFTATLDMHSTNIATAHCLTTPQQYFSGLVAYSRYPRG